MRRNAFLLVLVLLITSFYATAHALSVTLVKEGPASVSQAPLAVSDEKAITLTFGTDRIVIHDSQRAQPGKPLTSEDVPLSQLFVVRDHRAKADRTGYVSLYSRGGFHLAIVKDPEQLKEKKRVVVRPVTEDHVVLEKARIPKAKPDPEVEKLIDLLSRDQYKQLMGNLADPNGTRYACAAGQTAKATRIKDYFEDLGLQTSTQKMHIDCEIDCVGSSGLNVIGIKKGSVRPQEYYLVGGHYDSLSWNPCVRAPGANDNASGAAGVMELARIFSKVDTEASLIFVAFAGEEEGYYGSIKYVDSLVSSGMRSRIKGFVILDMISYYDNNYGIIIEGSNENLKQRTILKRLVELGSTYTELEMETSTDYSGSDHEPFLDKGMPGGLLIEADWDNYDFYHTVRDKMGYQIFPFGVEVLKLAAAMLADGGISFPSN